MYTEIKISNQNRINKHQNYSSFGKGCKDNRNSSSFVFVQKSIWENKLNYQYDPKNDPKILKDIKQEFLHNVEKKFNNGDKVRSKGLGRIDKYERNLETGKFLKQNPIVAVFKKIDSKLTIKEKQFAMDVMKYHFMRRKLN